MKGEIIEIGAYKLDEHGIDSVFQTFIKASAPLSNKVKSITKNSYYHYFSIFDKSL